MPVAAACKVQRAHTKSLELKFYWSVMGKNAMSAICHLLSWQPYFQVCWSPEREQRIAAQGQLSVLQLCTERCRKVSK